MTLILLLYANQPIDSKVKFVLFNDATGTHWFLSYHQLLDVIHMVTLTHVLEGNPLPPHRLLFSISSKGIFYMHVSIDRTVHTTDFDKPVVDHWLERKIGPNCSWVHWEGSIRRPTAAKAGTLSTELRPAPRLIVPGQYYHLSMWIPGQRRVLGTWDPQKPNYPQPPGSLHPPTQDAIHGNLFSRLLRYTTGCGGPNSNPGPHGEDWQRLRHC